MEPVTIKKRKELEVTITVRNNQLKERRFELGLSQPDFAARVGISVSAYRDLEKLLQPPWRYIRGGSRHAGAYVEGDWSDAVLKLAIFHKAQPEELFPEAVLAVVKPEQVMKVNFEELQPLLTLHEMGHKVGQLPSPEDCVVSNERQEIVNAVLDTLPPKLRRVMELRFYEDLTLGEIGVQLQADGYSRTPLSPERVRQMEVKALRMLQHPSRGAVLRPFLACADYLAGLDRARLARMKLHAVKEANERAAKAAAFEKRRQEHGQKILARLEQRYLDVNYPVQLTKKMIELFAQTYNVCAVTFTLPSECRSRYHHCPLCYQKLGDEGHCPNCGWIRGKH